ncbi:hypothetical protein Ctob_005724 [Chrysochromulina tobinii]|uniref:Uncharacterized protein n=1 Tax=Chrysochromulina tobinii TaxID=1460289 RepID=A0A0M0JUG9_9EUKA|nr:hypothetical protein Ctob_005724 [Chrysochromulina tobinii]|eukprot:KOO29773.1 hypothetical protein Ctob_005724 [Chrysochromulina sp. CCMP291]
MAMDGHNHTHDTHVHLMRVRVPSVSTAMTCPSPHAIPDANHASFSSASRRLKRASTISSCSAFVSAKERASGISTKGRRCSWSGMGSPVSSSTPRIVTRCVTRDWSVCSRASSCSMETDTCTCDGCLSRGASSPLGTYLAGSGGRRPLGAVPSVANASCSRARQLSS